MEMRRASLPENMRRYGAAILAAFAALILRSLLAPILGQQNPYHAAWAAVVFSSWFCGLGPSVVTVLVELVGVWYWFLPPGGSFDLSDRRTAIAGMVSFLFFSSFIIAFG